jgi:hypothetical protein
MAIREENIGHGGARFVGFDTMDEAFEYMKKHEDAANAQLFPQQKGMIGCKHDQWYVNIRFPWQEAMIFGEGWSLDHADKNELKCYGVTTVDELSKEDQEAYLWSQQSLKDSRERGYIFGNAFSVICPEGELGSTHVYDIWPISREAFEEGKEQNWRPVLDREHSPNLRRQVELMAAEIIAAQRNQMK